MTTQIAVGDTVAFKNKRALLMGNVVEIRESRAIVNITSSDRRQGNRLWAGTWSVLIDRLTRIENKS